MSTLIEGVGVPTLLHKFLERRPGLGIFASISGFAGSILAYMQQISIVLGFFGAIFGCVAGYVTMRVQLRRWKAIRNGSHDL